MATFKIKKGLDLPITGAPAQVLSDAIAVKAVAINGRDYIGMKPSVLVQVGDQVKIGQPLLACKKTEGVLYTSPAGGRVVEINRGDRRAFQNIVVEIAEHEEQVQFSHYHSKATDQYSREEIVALLVESGLWPAIRTRPFSKVPTITSIPHSLFITAIDTSPLAADPEVAINLWSEDFKKGVEVLSKLTDGKTFICRQRGIKLPVANSGSVEVHEFEGPHPAGLVGTHIHHLDPVGPKKTVWHIGYQDVIAAGRLFTTGKVMVERIISLAGPQVKHPRLLKTRLGAHLGEVTKDQLAEGESRIVSGSVLNGQAVSTPFFYLSRYANQVSVVREGREREFLGWQGPGFDRFSIKNTFLSKLIPGKKFPFSTSTNGSKRAMVPVGMFESVMPLDILPTQLLRALVTSDSDNAQALGCLELDEEDLGLCTFASPGKTDFGPALRETLTIIEKEG
jgi:Na+-transporting NADH:ubiquinone oxidoreductase subunit A